MCCSEDIYTRSFTNGPQGPSGQANPIEKYQLVGMSLKDCIASFPTIDVSDLDSLSSTTNKGNQEKWFYPDMNSHIKAAFDYQDIVWKDYLCEIIATKLGNQLGLDVVEAFPCRILDVSGVLSGSYTNSFLQDNEDFITFYRIFKHYGYNDDAIVRNQTVCKRIQWVTDRLNEFTNLDLSDYINRMIVLDFLVGNEDRHLNNFGVIVNRDTGKFRMAPLFDNGLSLLEHDRRYLGAPFQFSLKKMDGKPFCKSLKRAYEESRQMFPEVPKIDLDLGGLVLPSRRAFDYLKYSSEVMGLRLVASKEVYVIG